MSHYVNTQEPTPFPRFHSPNRSPTSVSSPPKLLRKSHGSSATKTFSPPVNPNMAAPRVPRAAATTPLPTALRPHRALAPPLRRARPAPNRRSAPRLGRQRRKKLQRGARAAPAFVRPPPRPPPLPRVPP